MSNQLGTWSPHLQLSACEYKQKVCTVPTYVSKVTVKEITKLTNYSTL